MDRSQDPCHDFFEYACGGWNKQQVIPDNKLEVDRFSQLNDDLQEKIKGLIERDPQPVEPASFSQARKYYSACLDQDTINDLEATPLIDILDSLGGWPVLGSNPGGNWFQSSYLFEKLWATLSSQYDVKPIISTGVQINIENSREYILQVNVPDFTVPTEFRLERQKQVSTLIPESISKDFGRHMLLLADLEDKRAAYLRYMIDIAVALGGERTGVIRDMRDVLEFEKTLARHAEDASVDTDDLPETKTRSDLQLVYNEINWAHLYQYLLPSSVQPPVSSEEPIFVVSPSYLRNVDTLLGRTDERVVANYMIWQLVNSLVPYLGVNYTMIYQKYLNDTFGKAAASDRWRRCAYETNSVVPFATGRMYVDEYFKTNTKTTTEQMVGDLRKALRVMLGRVSWLISSDQRKAQEKLDAMGINVGYPEWLEVDTTIDAKSADLSVTNTYFTNIRNYRRREAQTKLGRLRLPVDKSLWSVTGPAVVNAFYSPWDNGIVVPAGILQPPFYHPDLPRYSNFGGIGAVLGHEITHGFDNTGRQFDKNGNIADWWSLSSVIGFQDAAQCLVDQYSNFVMPENGKSVDGEQTEGENIADNGGVREAYKAYQDINARQRKQLPGLQDLTDEQMFFLSYSQVWCGVLTRAGADLQVKTGEHSPNRFRVIGPLQNNEDFTSAFNCPYGSHMRRSRRCKVWY
ncbi:endothelin-converting enzyme homolog isoform X2 [Acanthaster planci]|nr:endothelin-converting enzyme homolog isoform X2 [Acanthaster planci]